MTKQKKTTSALGLTALLTLILFAVILLLISFLAWFGYMGVKTGRISPMFLIERPSVMILTICVISLVLGAILMGIIRHLLIRPIGRMSQAMQQLAEGHFDTRIAMSDFRPKEILLFTENFNKAAEALGSVEILRSDFISNFSHEFRTPIHTLVSIAELLRSGECSPEETGEYLDIIIDQARRLSSLAANVLYLTRLETAAAPMETHELNLSELLRQNLVMFDHQCSEKRLDLQTDISPVQLRGNADLLLQMMRNILDNAIKFSPEGAAVRVELRAQEDRAVFRVTDHGCGMDQATLDHMFDKFYQGDTSHSAEGFGLGLPMVRRIVELHRGTITVESSVGTGSAFTVELPAECGA
ncbi:MAG: ATP-binding protein [Aristaeellaceae bacterium]